MFELLHSSLGTVLLIFDVFPLTKVKVPLGIQDQQAQKSQNLNNKK